MAMEALDNMYIKIGQFMPNNALVAAQKSFLYSGGIVTIISGGNIAAGVLVGSLAALASLIDSVISSVIRSLFDGRDHLNWYEDYGKRIAVLTITSLLVCPFLGLVVNVVATVAVTIIIDLCCPENLVGIKPLNEANPILLI